MKRLGRAIFLLSMCAVAGGCGGGGAGGTVGIGNVSPGTGSTPSNFTAFRNIEPDQTVGMTGLSQTVTAISADGVTISSRAANPVETGSSIELFHDAALLPTVIGFHTSRADLFWSGSSQIACGVELCLMRNAQTDGGLANAAGALGWNFQTFGYWLDAPTLTTRELGVISAGNATPAGSLPATGTAAYSGISAGLYVDPTGAAFEHVASMSALADFGAPRSIAFATARTELSSLQTGLAASAPDLDLAGTLTILPGTNRFSGTVTTAGSSLSGDATGQFYGPAAEEIGGVFTLLPTGGAGVETMNGGFGGRR
jgi:hypothetical protein